jgi:hypothetical protein
MSIKLSQKYFLEESKKQKFCARPGSLKGGIGKKIKGA